MGLWFYVFIVYYIQIVWLDISSYRDKQNITHVEDDRFKFIFSVKLNTVIIQIIYIYILLFHNALKLFFRRNLLKIV